MSRSDDLFGRLEEEEPAGRPARASGGEGSPFAEEAPPPRSARHRALTASIALGSVLGFVAIVWYAYDKRQPGGPAATAPLIAADPAPWKERPNDPGGARVPFQDSTVYDRLVPSDAPPRVERLLPPPEQPRERPPPLIAMAPDSPANPIPPPAPEPPTEPPTEAGATTDPMRPVDLPSELVPESPSPAPAQSAPAQNAPAQSAPAQAAPEPPPTSIEDLIARAGGAPPPAAAKAAAPKTAEPKITGPARPVPGGSYTVQLAAVPAQTVAESELRRLSGKHKAVLGALTGRVAPREAPGGKMVYGVKFGPLDEAGAKALCALLETRNQPCLISR